MAGSVKRRCRWMMFLGGMSGITVECQRRHGHGGRWHKAKWTEGVGGKWADVSVRWPTKTS